MQSGAGVAGAMLWFVLLNGDERQSIADRVRRMLGSGRAAPQAVATR